MTRTRHPATRAAFEHRRAVLFLLLLTWAMLGRWFLLLATVLAVLTVVRALHRRRGTVRARAAVEWERAHPLPSLHEARATIRRLDPELGAYLDLIMPLEAYRKPLPRVPAGPAPGVVVRG